MKRVAMAVALLLLSGCAATDLIGAAVGTKPELTAQVGAENTKQTVGLNNKIDASNDTDVKAQSVGKVDTSSGKKLAATAITAGTINADRIEVRNTDSSSGWVIYVALALMLIPTIFIIWLSLKKKDS